MINDVTSLEELRQVVAVGQGFLYNDFGGTKPEYCLIHRVGCNHVDRMLKVKKGRLTYSKVWSDELTSLQTWLNQNARIFALCSACEPGVSDSSSPRLQLDPNHQWAFVSSAPGEPRVQLWTAWRMPFETDQSEEQRRLVALIAPHLRTLSCGPGQQLHGRFVHEDRNGRQPDAENVTFYNWRRGDGQCPFSGRSLSFERSYAPPPPAPVQNHLKFFTEWSVRAAGSDIGGWLETGQLASWSVPFTGDTGGRHIWRAIREGGSQVFCEFPYEGYFGVDIALTLPERSRFDPVEALKGCLDGAIASFHRFPEPLTEKHRDILRKHAHWRGWKPPLSPGAFEDLATGDLENRLFPGAPFNLNGLDPSDDRCVVGRLTARQSDESGRPQLSGRIYGLKPKIDDES